MSVRVAVIDSGVNRAHPHIHGVAGGVTIGSSEDYVDLLGHGTAVMAAIQEKAPEAEYYAVRVFRSSLRTSIHSLLEAIEWCVGRRMDVINLSLGTANPAHAVRFAPVIEKAAEAGCLLVSAREALPGSLPGVFGVTVDWECPREAFYYQDGAWRASGYPRSMPGVPRERNLHGASFAVANMSGFVAIACQELESRTYESVAAALLTDTSRYTPVAASHSRADN